MHIGYHMGCIKYTRIIHSSNERITLHTLTPQVGRCQSPLRPAGRSSAPRDMSASPSAAARSPPSPLTLLAPSPRKKNVMDVLAIFWMSYRTCRVSSVLAIRLDTSQPFLRLFTSFFSRRGTHSFRPRMWTYPSRIIDQEFYNNDILVRNSVISSSVSSLFSFLFGNCKPRLAIFRNSRDVQSNSIGYLRDRFLIKNRFYVYT